MKKHLIPYGKHFIDEDDIKSVIDVLRNQNLTQGKNVDYFEEAVAEFIGSKYAVAMSSWTSRIAYGLHSSRRQKKY